MNLSGTFAIPLTGDAGDGRDSTDRAVRAALLGDGGALDPLADGKCRPAEREEERDQRNPGSRGDREASCDCMAFSFRLEVTVAR